MAIVMNTTKRIDVMHIKVRATSPLLLSWCPSREPAVGEKIYSDSGELFFQVCVNCREASKGLCTRFLALIGAISEMFISRRKSECPNIEMLFRVKDALWLVIRETPSRDRLLGTPIIRQVH